MKSKDLDECLARLTGSDIPEASPEESEEILAAIRAMSPDDLEIVEVSRFVVYNDQNGSDRK